MITCSCGREQYIPPYPHKDNIYRVRFLSNEIVIVTVQCECGKYLTTTYQLSVIETIEEAP